MPGMLTVQVRSLTSLIVILCVSTGFSLFLIQKSHEAIREIDALNAGPLALRRALAQGLDSPTIADISGWKTYRNEKYGFEVKYPDYYEALKEALPGVRPTVMDLDNEGNVKFGREITPLLSLETVSRKESEYPDMSLEIVPLDNKYRWIDQSFTTIYGFNPATSE